jgi:hypothetical protein
MILVGCDLHSRKQQVAAGEVPRGRARLGAANQGI